MTKKLHFTFTITLKTAIQTPTLCTILAMLITMASATQLVVVVMVSMLPCSQSHQCSHHNNQCQLAKSSKKNKMTQCSQMSQVISLTSAMIIKIIIMIIVLIISSTVTIVMTLIQLVVQVWHVISSHSLHLESNYTVYFTTAVPERVYFPCWSWQHDRWLGMRVVLHCTIPFHSSTSL